MEGIVSRPILGRSQGLGQDGLGTVVLAGTEQAAPVGVEGAQEVVWGVIAGWRPQGRDGLAEPRLSGLRVPALTVDETQRDEIGGEDAIVRPLPAGNWEGVLQPDPGFFRRAPPEE